MVLDSLRSSCRELVQECDSMMSATEQLFDDLDLLVQHVELAGRAGSHGDAVTNELVQMRQLIQQQGELLCLWVEGVTKTAEKSPGPTSKLKRT